MKRFLKSINVHELLRPLGQLFFFSLGTTVVLSAIVLILALILDRTVVGQTLFERLNVSLYTYTLVNLPQVAIDGLTIGFVYAAIALGYTMVYGEISREMISSIFWPDNPVHDGAMLIEGNQITEVGVILPLSYRQDLPSYYGTRHRAAVGIAEMTDAMVIVVSEERGTILAIKGSRIQRILKVEDLITVLQEHTGETDNTKKSIRRDRMEFLAAAMVSFMVITGIWLTIARGLDTLVTLEIPIEYMNRSPAIEIMDASVNSVRIQLGGSGALIKSIRPEQVRVRIDLGRSFVGSNTFTITNENISLPPGVFIKSFQPSAVDVILDIPVSKEIPIQVDWTGKLPENLRIERIALDPEKITVVGGSQILKNIQTIYTEKIPLDNLTTSRSMTVNLALRPASLKVGPGFREKLVVEYVVKEKTAKEAKP